MLRPLIVYAFLVLAFRLSGKRLLAQLNPFDLVVILILSNTVQNAIIGNDNSLTGGLLGATALLFANSFLLKRLYPHQKLQEWLEGKPDPLIEHGQLVEANLHREGLLKSELVTAANNRASIRWPRSSAPCWRQAARCGSSGARRRRTTSGRRAARAAGSDREAVGAAA